MTDNNGIPFEVKKPFETVCELKNETQGVVGDQIPSFEEFMKTYEADESLNYEDLSYSDISVKGKGYGPCSGYWNCNDSRCYSSNPNACRSGERFYVLETPCPAVDCPKKQRGPATYWYHHNPSDSRCGSSKDKISDECRIRCPDCFNTTHMRYHKFRCSEHDGHFWKTSATSFIAAINLGLGLELPTDVYNKIMNGIKDEHKRSGGEW